MVPKDAIGKEKAKDKTALMGKGMTFRARFVPF